MQFRAFNQGGSAAAELTIEGEVTGPDGSGEMSEAVLDYVPARSSREGELWFSGDPRAGRPPCARPAMPSRDCRARPLVRGETGSPG